MHALDGFNRLLKGEVMRILDFLGHGLNLALILETFDEDEWKIGLEAFRKVFVQPLGFFDVVLNC
jgi:hypothetical protein